MNRSRSLMVIVTLFVALHAPSARADASAASGTAAELFDEARSDMRRGAYAEAYPKLVESEHVDPSNGTLLNLVICEEKLGKVASAWLHVRELSDRLGSDDERAPFVARKLTTLAPRVPRLTVRLAATAPPGTRVLLDDVELAPPSLGVPLPVDPGVHRIVARLAGAGDRVDEVSVAEAQEYEWLAEPSLAGPSEVPRARQRAGEARRDSAPSRPPNPGGARWLGWTATGAGAAALVTGTILGALTLHERARVAADCPERICKDSSGLQAAEDGKRLLAGSIAALAVGAVGIGVGVYVLTNAGRGDVPGGQATARSPAGAILTYAGAF